MSDHGSLPSRWIFLITAFALLLTLGVLIIIFQHWQRTLLSSRIANGEVDLEALGIQHLYVPQAIIEKLPKYIYSLKSGGVPPSADERLNRQVPYSQPACPICLDDFIHNETTIRELPCRHIFHPDCIDLFLTGSSSLCPMCKKSAFPKGYCPVHVTNLMVRRERLLRRMRQRNQEEPPCWIPAVGAIERQAETLPTPRAPIAMIHNSPIVAHGTCNGEAEVVAAIGMGKRPITYPAVALNDSQESDMQPPIAEA